MYQMKIPCVNFHPLECFPSRTFLFVEGTPLRYLINEDKRVRKSILIYGQSPLMIVKLEVKGYKTR